MSAATVKQKAALWVGVVFVLGVSLGGVLGYVLANKVAGASPAVLTDAARRAQKVDALTKELGLSAEQQKQLDRVLAETQTKFKAIHDSTQPQIDETRKGARNEIRSFLTPEQLPKFEEHLRKLDEERKKKEQH
jgi:esterase/lipase